jgi:glycosyltransferase involved in cell wall biosynthesis
MIDNDSSPLVTVYIPTYNRRNLLERAAQSVLEQTYKNIELIIVDDKSDDDTIRFLEELSRLDKRVRYFQNMNNSGACVSRNKAILEARGEFVTGLDDDDYFLSGRVESFVSNWKVSSKDTVALYSNLLRSSKSGLKKASSRLFICTYSDLVYANWPGNQIFTRTEWLRDIGGFDLDLPAWQDIDCWYRLLFNKKGVAYCVPSYSYVLDVSHDYERISQKSADKLVEAWSIFCCKNCFSDREKIISRLMLASYGVLRPDIKSLLLKIIGMPKWKNVRHAAVLCFTSILMHRGLNN